MNSVSEQVLKLGSIKTMFKKFFTDDETLFFHLSHIEIGC